MQGGREREREREREGDPCFSPKPASYIQQTLSFFSKEQTLNSAACTLLHLREEKRVKENRKWPKP
jgi:hypothetical protein